MEPEKFSQCIKYLQTNAYTDGYYRKTFEIKQIFDDYRFVECNDIY